MMLRTLDHVPPGLLDCEAPALAERLGGPTLFRLPGARPEPLFVSVLLHGNEVSGWNAARALLARHAGRRLPRALALLVGNVQAAREGRRRLDGQPDFNRIWRGGTSPEEQMAAGIVDAMRDEGVFACVDVHNNSGSNPHYACVNTLDPEGLELAAMFTPLVVYSTDPDTVLSLAFSAFCPAVTLECGLPGRGAGGEHAARFLETCLHLAEFPERLVPPSEIDLYRNVARVRVANGASFGFDRDDVDLRLDAAIEQRNFDVLPAGTPFARVRPGSRARLEARDAAGVDHFERFFALSDDALVTREPVVPAMFTRDERIIRQDCLCYLMERFDPA